MAESQPSLAVPAGAKSSYDRWIEGEGIPVIHGNGAHVITLGGEGYSLIWPDNASIKKRAWRNEALLQRGEQSQMAQQSEKK